MHMRRRLTQVVGVLVVATCLACPISEMFDHWDHTARTGKDTESTLVLVALSVGMMFPSAAMVALPAIGRVATGRLLPIRLHVDVPARVEAFDAMSNSPPPLRI